MPLPALLAMERERRQGGPPPGAGDGGPAANRTHTLLSQQGRYEEGMEGWMVDSHREPALPHWLQAARAGTRAERSQQQQPQQVLRPAQQPQPQSLEPPLQQCKAGPASPSSPTSPCQLRMFTTRQYRRVPRAPRMLPAWLLAALVTVYVFFGLAHALGPLRQVRAHRARQGRAGRRSRAQLASSGRSPALTRCPFPQLLCSAPRRSACRPGPRRHQT